MSEPLPLSLVVITRNEAAHIGRCLDSVPFAAEKFVLDSGSNDDTVAIARAHGARVEHQDWLGFGAQRNAAAARARHDWQLVLDADETLSPELAIEPGTVLENVLRIQLATTDAPLAPCPLADAVRTLAVPLP